MTLVWCPIVGAVAEIAVDKVEVTVAERRGAAVKVVEHHWCAGCGSGLP